MVMKKIIALALSTATLLSVSTGCKKKLPKFELELGDTITMGEYQGEAIEWEVKHRTFEVGQNKVIVEFQSTTAVECLPFNEDGRSSWEYSTLREWLNTDFYEEAFSKSEKEQILYTSYCMYTGNARWLKDYVYLSDEFPKYQMDPAESTCKPSEHAKAQGIRTENGSCAYWTRDVVNYVGAATGSSAGKNAKSPASTAYPLCLGTSQSVPTNSDESFILEDVGVRPWISIEYEGTFEMKDINPADRVILGTYDGDPITWIVIESNKDGLELLSKYGLEKMQMDMDPEETVFAETDLHDWLNEDFYKEAFSKDDKKVIVANDEDDNVSLIGKISMRDGFSRDCIFELVIGSGYSRAYCDNNKVTEREALDVFWCNYVAESNSMLATFQVSGILQNGKKANEEFSVRPFITIKF